MIKYSIIVPIFNQVDFLPAQIKMYNMLWSSRNDFEVLWMDDGSTDTTRQYMEKGTNDRLFPYTYEWEENKNFGVTRAKNRGIRKAKGQWQLILDGDTYIDPQVLKAYDRVLKDKDVIYFGKRYSIKLKDLDRALHYGFPSVVENKSDWRGFLQQIPPAPFSHFSGSNFVISSKLGKELEYAPDDWNFYGYDDYFFAINCLIHGHKFEPVNDSVAYHCEDKPKEGHPVTRERLNAFIKEHEAELQQLGGVRYF